jgi:hypothetical protein
MATGAGLNGSFLISTSYKVIAETMATQSKDHQGEALQAACDRAGPGWQTFTVIIENFIAIGPNMEKNGLVICISFFSLSFFYQFIVRLEI